MSPTLPPPKPFSAPYLIRPLGEYGFHVIKKTDHDVRLYAGQKYIFITSNQKAFKGYKN